MLDITSKYGIIFFSSMLKFVAGPLVGAMSKLPIITTALFTILGATTSVVVTTIIGDTLRVFLKKRRDKRKKQQKIFTKKKRKIITIYNRFGIKGIAFLTPLILTPIGGTIVALSFGVPRKRILTHMIVSIVIWGFVITTIVILFSKEIFQIFGKPTI